MIKNYDQIYRRKYIATGGACEVCGQPLESKGQLAHRIAKSKSNIRAYGLSVIDSSVNLALVCGLKCNAAVLVRTPREIAEIVEAAKRRK